MMEKRIVPSEPHEPPLACPSKDETSVLEPDDNATVNSFWPAKKPMER